MLDCVETVVMGVLGVAEYESGLKIYVAPFLGPLSPNFARNLGITREWWVVRHRGRLHGVSRRILNKDREPWRKYKKRENCKKSPYYVW